MKRFIGLVIALAALVALPAIAQQKTSGAGATAILAYFQNASGDMIVKQADGKELSGDSLDIGMEIPIGSTVVTFDGDTAEVRLQPNGSIIKVAANTNFQIEGLQGAGGADASRFSVAVGKIRNVAGKATGNEKYVFKGASTVCGVRGTDWSLQVVPGKLERALTFKGVIEFTNAAGQTLELVAGKYADALAGAFQVLEITQEILDEAMQDLEFLQLNPDEVPGQTAEAAPAAAETTTVATSAADVQETPEETPAEAPAPEAPKPPAPESAILKWLREVLGMEIGSLTIGDSVYSKAVLQPTFALGKLKLSLYLPVIYKSNMFDPADWYHPAGNDEWSFGTDQADDDGTIEAAEVLNIVKDAASDLFLKIRYIQFGEQRDPFFFKVGNLNNITIGSGFIMRDFANDSEFPSVRRVGVNLGVDGKAVGFEVMANDLASLPPEIFGGRFYVKPFGKLAIGVGVVADINPSGTLLSPAFFHAGFNLDLPIVRTKFLSLILFADVASSVPYFAEDYTDPATGETVVAGMHFEALLDPSAPADVAKLKNWGFAAGLQGNILIAKYRLEYRYFTGTFRPAYFDTGYERERPRRVSEVVSYLNHMNDTGYINLVMGIYGEAGFSLLKDKITFTAGYMWPWVPGVDMSTLTPDLWPDDFLTLKLSVAQGVIPVIGIYGSLSFERSRFASTLAGAANASEALATLFDANTLAKLEIVYPVAAIMDMALTITTTVRYDENGVLVLVPGTALPQLDPSVNVEMRMHL